MSKLTTLIPEDEREALSERLAGGLRHASDCAVYNAPAYDPKPCDCGVQLKAERRYVAWLNRLFCIQLGRWKRSVRSKSGL